MDQSVVVTACGIALGVLSFVGLVVMVRCMLRVMDDADVISPNYIRLGARQNDPKTPLAAPARRTNDGDIYRDAVDVSGLDVAVAGLVVAAVAAYELGSDSAGMSSACE